MSRPTPTSPTEAGGDGADQGGQGQAGQTAPAAALELRLLGAVEVRRGEQLCRQWPSRAAQLLLARLALAPDRQHPREELVELLWPGVAPAVGRNRLRQVLATLRDALRPLGAAELIEADRHVLRLAAQGLRCDVQALRDALRTRAVLRVQELDRGELLPGHFDEWVVDERRVLAAEIERFVADRVAGASAVPVASAASAVVPPLTTSAPALPVYLTRMHGHVGLAAEVRAALWRHRLVVLRGPGGAGKTRLAVEVARQLSPAPSRAGADPAFDTIGFVAAANSITVAACGEAALAVLQPAGGEGPAGLLRERLVQSLAGRRVLLVLDNVEQLVPSIGAELAAWLAASPGLHLLVTSRRVLAVEGEHELPVVALPLPALPGSLREHLQSPAISLFVDRARDARADFALDADSHADVAAIVTRLQGLPLALELAAARLRSLGLPELRALLESRVDGSLHPAADADGATPPLLALLSRRAGGSGHDPRHASLEAVVRWSLEPLPAPARALLTTLCLFDGGAGLEALAEVAGVPMLRAAERIDELVGASLVQLQEQLPGHARYHVYGPVREVVLWRTPAAERQGLQRRRLQWLHDWAARRAPHLHLGVVAAEMPNLQAALRLAVRSDEPGQLQLALRLMLQLQPVLVDIVLGDEVMHHLGVLVAEAEQGLAGSDGESSGAAAGARLARLAGLMAEQHFERGERDAAKREAARARRLLGGAASLSSPLPQRLDRALALYSVARMAVRVDQDLGSESLLEEALALLPPPEELASEHVHEVARVRARLLQWASVYAVMRHHDPPRKVALSEQSLALWRAHGPSPRLGEGLVNLALALGFQRRPQAQLPLLEQARESCQRHGQLRLLAFVCSVHAYALADLRRWDAAAASFRECLHIAWTGAAWRSWFYGLWNLPRVLAHQRRPREAALVMAFADRFGHERFGQLGQHDLRERRRTRRLVRVQLGAAAEAALWSEGRGLAMADVMTLAFGHTGAGARL